MDILFNMWALVFVGPSLEGLLGRVRFLAVYLLSAVGGGVMYYFLAPPNNPAVGASGAIFGLFGAWFVVSRRLRLDTRGIVMLIAINLALSFFFHNVIAWQDHIGGLLTGALLTAAYAYAPRKNRTAVQVAATIALVALIVVAVAVRNARDDEGEPDHEIPRPERLHAGHRTLSDVIHRDPGEADDQAHDDARTDPWRTDLPPCHLGLRRRVDRLLTDARLGHNGLLRSNPAMRT